MKMTRIIILILFFIPIIHSCQLDDEVVIRHLDPEGDYMTVNIDGDIFYGELVSAKRLDITGGFSISASTVEGRWRSIDLSISPRSNDDSPLGLYPVESGFFVERRRFDAVYTDRVNWTEYEFISGKLILEELDTINQRIKGSFNFNGQSVANTVSSLTEGEFDIGYKE